MRDDVEQLLRNLKLARIAEILDNELAHAEREQLSHQDLLARLLRAQWHHAQEQALSWRIRKARMPEQWTLESFPYKRQPGVSQKQIVTDARTPSLAG